MIDCIGDRSSPFVESVYLLYAGMTAATTPLGRLRDDLRVGASHHFGNFAKTASRVRREHAFPSQTSLVYQFNDMEKLTEPSDARTRHDLQAAKRALISAIQVLGLNSAPGGFNHPSTSRARMVLSSQSRW